MNDKTRIILNESDLPKTWYNLAADLPFPMEPVLDPHTHTPLTAEGLQVLFPPALAEQEVTLEREIEIPEEVQEALRLWRPTPLIRARRLEKALGTPAHIYYKYEGVSPSGSHKSNTAIPQAFYNHIAGTHAMTTETGAGQWGSALAMACGFYNMDLEVYMVKVSYEQKPYRRYLMETYGAQVFASPSDRTRAGQTALAENPNHPGSLGMAISEAVEAAVLSNGTKKYGLGSVLNHVLLHQTVIGDEAIKQMDLAGEYPDVVIGCVGGGSNFAGIAFPFLREQMRSGTKTRFLAVEPEAAPSLTRGKYAFDFGDSAGMTPIMKMYTLGHDFVPPSIHAGGLRYHGMSPLISSLYHNGMIEATAVSQEGVFDAAILFARCEGILPAPESGHAICAAIHEALQAREKGVKQTILFNLSGHGHFDLTAYHSYREGALASSIDCPLPENIQNHLPQIMEPSIS